MRHRERRARARWAVDRCRDRGRRSRIAGPVKLMVSPGVVTADRTLWREALQKHGESKYSVDVVGMLRRRDLLLRAVENEELVMKRDNNKIWRWRASSALDARAVSLPGKAPGGKSPLIVDALWVLPWQVSMELDAEFRKLYEDPSLPLPDSWRVLRMTMLRKMQNAQIMNKFGASACSMRWRSATRRHLRGSSRASSVHARRRPIAGPWSLATRPAWPQSR